MTLIQSDFSELLDALRAGGDLDIVRELAAFVLQAFIDAEATEHIGVTRFKRSEHRAIQRNSNRVRLVSIEAGDGSTGRSSSSSW